ncbi:hypothetical protein [Actinoplanes sp. NPDC049802]|uniref:hypothetical protein n=1 Tax=Actinoplanes sp. NPDC049802 TaxID=3154742 RepID=UPI003405EAAE
MGIKPNSNVQPDRLSWPGWLNPALSLIIAMTVPTAAVSLTPDELFTEVTGLPPASPDFLARLAVVNAAAVVGLALASCIVPRSRFHYEVEPELFRWRARLLAGVTTAAYLFFGALVFARGMTPQLALAVLSSEYGALQASRAAFVPVAGITTLVAFGGPAICALVVSSVHRALTRPEIAAIVVIATGAMARGFLNAERLAIMELAIPALLGLVAKRRIRRGAEGLRSASAPALIVAGVGAFALFAAGELLRPSYQVREGSVDFGSYIYGRFFSYYLSSTANGEYLSELISNVPTPTYTAQAFWTFPGVDSLISPATIYGYDPSTSFHTMLEQYLNPEMNTVGVGPSLLAEWGLPGASAIVLAMTLALTLAWKAGLHRLTAGAVPLLAVLTIAALESARYPYYFQGRFVVAALGALWIYRSRHARRMPTVDE